MVKRPAEHIGRASIWTGSRRVKWLAILGALHLLFTATPFAGFYSNPLSGGSDPQKSDVIVLLSSSQIDSEWLTTDASERVLGALKLYREHYAPLLSVLEANSKPVDTRQSYRRYGSSARGFHTRPSSLKDVRAEPVSQP
jgi:hypothetical protein